MTTSADIKGINQRIQRITISDALAIVYAASIDNGTITHDTYVANTVNAALTQHSTKPALIVVNFFEGLVPISTRLDSLAAFCTAQYNSYASQGVPTPEIGPYEALGAAFSTEASFATFVSGKTTQQVITDAYNLSMDAPPGSAQLQHFVDQYTYFYNLYHGSGMSTSAADAKAKGAVIGQILYYGGTTPGTTYYYKSTTWLVQAGNGLEGYGVAW